MNTLKKYREQIEAAVAMGCLPAAMVACYVLEICKHC